MARWLNIAGYQLVWLAAVTSAAKGQPWFAVAASALFVAAQVMASGERASDLRNLGLAILMGMLIDGGLAAAGLVRYSSPHPALFAPIWILGIWAAFALTLNHSLAFLHGRPLVAGLLGAVGGPLAYSAAREFGALSFAEPASGSLFALACAWAVAMALLVIYPRSRPLLPGITG